MRSKSSGARSDSTASSISDSSVASLLSAIHSGVSTAAHAGSQLPAVEDAESSSRMPAPLEHTLASPVSLKPKAAEGGTTRSKSSPFQAAGLSWAAELAADADVLSASIQSASAVHNTSPAVPQPAPPSVANRRLVGRRSKPVVAASNLNPYLSTHTSVMLKNMPNPLEDVFQDGLGAKDMPVLFLHGVGGLPAYLEMLLQVMALGHPLIVVQFNAVAMRLSDVDTADQAVDKVVGILDKLEVPEACVIGHSYGEYESAIFAIMRCVLQYTAAVYRCPNTTKVDVSCLLLTNPGTFVAGRLARLHSKRVHSLCLIDPVVFGMFMPQLLANFLYKTPEWRGLHQ